MVARSERPTGNQYVFVVNTMLWNSAQRVLANWIRDYKTNGAFVYSKGANGYVDLGATFNSYSFAGKSYCSLAA